MLAIFKNNLPTDITAWVIFGLVILMAASIQIYAKIRRRNQEKLLVQMNQINQNNPTDQIPQVQN
jgi:putative membrane protein